MSSPLGQLVRHELRFALRQGSAGSMVVAFFVIAASLFPLAVGPEAEVLSRIGSGVLWVAALLAALLSLERLFQMDIEDGFMDQLVLSPWPLEMIVFAKTFSHWVVTAVPLIIISPVIGMMFNLADAQLQMLVLSLAIGTPALSFIGAMGASITALVKRGGLLLSLLVLPLYIPTLIFGVMAVGAVSDGGAALSHLMLLGAVSLLAIAFSPFAAAAAIRLALE